MRPAASASLGRGTRPRTPTRPPGWTAADGSPLGPADGRILAAVASKGRAQVERGAPYRWVETKSRGAPVFSVWTSRSSTQPTAAVAGPPTRRPGSTDRTARAAVSYSRR